MASIVWELDLTWNNSDAQNTDFYRSKLCDVLKNKGLVSNGIAQIVALGKVGKDARLLIKEQEYYNLLVNYLVILQELSTAYSYTGDEQVAFVKEFDLDCVRNTFLCQYGNTGNRDFVKSGLIELLVSQLDLSCTNGEGISLMNINNPTCNTFAIYPA